MELGNFHKRANKHEQLLEAEAHIWNHMFSYISSMSLNCAVQLGIPDVINNHGGPMTLFQLVEALPINKAKGHGVYRLMRILVHSGFFHKQKNISEDGDQEEDAYVLAPSSLLLLKDEPLSLRPLYLLMLCTPFVDTWNHVTKWLQNEDSTPLETAKGSSTLWDFLPHEPEILSIFNDAMASDSLLLTGLVIEECKELLAAVNSVVDVGGGTGTLGRAIASAFPHLHCTVFDLPHVVANLEGTNNLSYVGGSMLEEIPSADAIIFKWVLHDWNDEGCIKILKLCKEAIPSREKGGKIIIIDMVVDEDDGDYKKVETKLFLDLEMMMVNTGKERNEKEWELLIKGSGFKDYKITHVLGLRSLIEIYP